MKNKFVRVLIILLFIISIFFIQDKIFLQSVEADSGWDSDYDSGGSWDSGSDWGGSWDSDSSWDRDYDHSSSSGESDPMLTFLMIIVFLVLSLIIKMISASNEQRQMWKDLDKNEDRDEDDEVNGYDAIDQYKANKVIPNFDINSFNIKAYKIFYDVQIAWMKFDYDKLKELLTDELYNTYEMDLEALKLKHGQNIMTEFELIKSKLIDLKKVNKKYVAKVLISVKFYDYVIDVDTRKIIRGTNCCKLHNTYILTFERSKEIPTSHKCPNCGADVNGNNTGVCEYCHSKLINNNYDWIMSKKEKIKQK